MGASELESPHAILVSWTGQGHVSGFMQLGRSLAALGFRITFVYFSSFYAKLKASNRLVLPYPSYTAHLQDPHPQNGTSNGLSGNGNHTGNGKIANGDANGSVYTGVNGGTNGSAHSHAIGTATLCNNGGANGTVHTIANGGAYNGSVHPNANGTATVRNGSGASHGRIEICVLDDGFAPGDIDKHFFVTPTMKENLYNLILELRDHGTPPTCLVTDTFVPWTVDVAKRAGIPRIDYWTSNALAYLTMINLRPLYCGGIFPEKGSSTKWKRETPLMLDHIPGLAPFSSELYPHYLRFTDMSHPLASFFCEVSSYLENTERILIHTMPEIEVDAFRAFQVAGFSAYGIGPLADNADNSKDDRAASSQTERKSDAAQLTEEKVDCISWLNTRADSSVIYIAFGSFATIPAEEIQELAFGLEASGSPFLWAIREDSLNGATLTEVLPKGFLEQTSKRGLVMGWAPQVAVLAHKAIGGFLTHCGWNSSMESFWEGVPMLCCPLIAEQRSNMYHLCSVWGVGLELERTNTGGIERKFVELGVKAMMQEIAGLKARDKAQKMKQLARKTSKPGGQSFSNLQKFYDDMKLLCSRPIAELKSQHL